MVEISCGKCGQKFETEEEVSDHAFEAHSDEWQTKDDYMAWIEDNMVEE